MKWILLLICAAAAWFVWNKSHQQTAPSQVVITDAPPITTSTPAIASTPTPPPLPAEAKPRLAPEGVYFVLERISVTTDSGVIGLAPGAKVRRLQDNGSTLKVTDGNNEFTLTPTQVTNDLDAVAQIAQAEKQKSAAISDWQQSQRAIARFQEQQNIKQLDASNAAQQQTETLMSLQTRYNQLTQQESILIDQVKNARDQRYSSHSQIHQRIPTAGELTALNQQLTQIRSAKQTVQQQINALQR